MSSSEQIIQALLNEVTAFAEQLLIEHGAFAPFAATLNEDGSIAGVDDTERADGETSGRIEHLRALLTEAAKNPARIATAVVYEVLLEAPDAADAQDAIAVELDDVHGYSAVVHIPYELDNQSIQYGELSADQGAQQIFVQGDGAK